MSSMRSASKKAGVAAWAPVLFAAVLVALLMWPASQAHAAVTTIEVTASDISSKGIYDAIQDALDEAHENASASNIYKVNVAAGSYTLDGTLYIYSYTFLDVEGCTFTQPSGAEYNMIKIGDNHDTQQGYYYQSITIYGGTWDENGNSNTLIKLAHAQKVTVVNATFQNCYNSHLMEVAGVNGLIIDSCTFQDQSLDTGLGETEETPEAIQLDILTDEHFNGYLCEDLPLKNISITNCTFSNVPRAIGSHTAVLNNPIDGITISNNTFTNTGSAAIQLMNVVNCTISGNTMTGVARGIAIYSFAREASEVYVSTILEAEGGVSSSTSNSYETPTDANIVIKSNTITLSSSTDKYGDYESCAILLCGLELTSDRISSSKGTVPAGNYYLTGATISNNTIVTTGYGIRVSDVRDVTISNNTITNTNSSATMHGVSATEGSQSVSITGNTIKDFYRGVFVNGASAVKSIANNTITNASNNGIMVDDDATVTDIKSNTITNAGKNGIHVYDGAVVTNVSGNTVTSPGNYGIIVEDATVTNIESNKVTKTTTFAIFAHTGSTIANISGNTITSCTSRAIAIQALSCDLTVANNTVTDCDADYLVQLNPGTNAYTITVKGNTITGTSAKSAVGIRIDSGTAVVTSNTISSCNYPITASSSATVSLSDNTYTSNTNNSAKV